VTPPSVAVVVPTYNRRDLLLQTIRSIEALRHQPDEVVVVSDGSTDGSDAAAAALGVTVLRTDRAGAAGARNRGWRTVRAEVVAFVDDDCTADPGWLDALVRPFGDPSVGLVQGRTVPAGPVRPHDRTIDVASEYGLYESCNIAYRRDALDAVDGFDESFGTRFGGRPFGEDTDLAWRVRRAGWRSAFAADAVVRHHVFPGTWRDSVREEWRRGRFPYLVREIPELRTLLPAGAYTLRRQSVVSQLALLSLLLATRRPPALLLALPHLGWLARRHRGPRAVARQAALDAVASAALLAGSVRHRSLLL
jgi:GT2 family glycosyltransferase